MVSELRRGLHFQNLPPFSLIHVAGEIAVQPNLLSWRKLSNNDDFCHGQSSSCDQLVTYVSDLLCCSSHIVAGTRSVLVYAINNVFPRPRRSQAR